MNKQAATRSDQGSLFEGAVSWGGQSTPARLTEGVIPSRETPSIPAGKPPPSWLRRATSLKERGFSGALFIIRLLVQLP